MENIKNFMEENMNLKYLEKKGEFLKFEYIKDKNNFNYFAKCFDGIYLMLVDYKSIDKYFIAREKEYKSMNISYCIEGQMKWQVPSTKEHAYLTKNTLIIDCESKHAKTDDFPENHLKCITYIIFLNEVTQTTKNIMKSFNIDLEKLYEKFSNRINFIKKDKTVNEVFNKFKGENFYDLDKYKLSFIEILLYLKNIQVSKRDNLLYLPKSHTEKVQRVEKLITQDFKKKYTLDELAQEVNMSKTYLNRAFKEVYGLSVHSYLIERKIEYAKEKIKKDNVKITEIASEVGYSNASKFSNIFKKVEGVNPREYKGGTDDL